MGGRGSSSGKAGSGASQWEQTYKTTTVYGVTYEGFRLGNMEIQGSAGLYRVFDTSTKRGSKKPIRTLDTLRKAKSYAEKYSKEKMSKKNINSANKRAGNSNKRK